jgi:mannose-6-phosphate isomerase-like protein (cupin superfamily)
MLRSGDMLENPVTGERLVFQQTAAETGGEWTRFDTYVRPGGTVASAHVHPYQTERFTVRAGQLGVKLGRKSYIVGKGETIVIPAGAAHKFWNTGDEELHFVASVSPAREFESLISTMFSLAADGKTNKKGMPNPLRLAVIAQAHFDTVRLPVVPHWMQRAALMVGATMGKAVGYDATYEPAAPQAGRQGAPVTA